jgi:hypothetical protein
MCRSSLLKFWDENFLKMREGKGIWVFYILRNFRFFFFNQKVKNIYIYI